MPERIDPAVELRALEQMATAIQRCKQALADRSAGAAQGWAPRERHRSAEEDASCGWRLS